MPPLSLTKLAALLHRADRMLSSPVEEYREQGRVLLAEVARQAPAALNQVVIECARCCRYPRAWFATGVADAGLHPLCSRDCVQDWLRVHEGYRVETRDGRVWRQDWNRRQVA
jgi:hypothetical protein